ncbi:MAG: peptidyl-dipeptidase A, partial [Flavobacteriaceae bacterium]
MRNLWILILLFVLACAPAPKEKAQAFIDEYTNIYNELYYASAKAEWEANTKIKEGDTTNAYLVQQANEALAKFTGSEANIQAINSLIAVKNELDPLQVKQLETMLYAAANNPAIIPDVVAKRIKAEAAQNELLFGFDFQIDGKSLSTNAIDAILTSSNDLAERQKAWEASKAVGVTLKSGLSNLRDLRNETVGALGYPDYFTYQVSNYGMTSEEMMTTCDQLVK